MLAHAAKNINVTINISQKEQQEPCFSKTSDNNGPSTSTTGPSTSTTGPSTSTSDENSTSTTGPSTSTSDENSTSTSDENTGATSTTSDEITNGLVKADLVQLISDLESVSSTLKKINRGFVGHEYTEAFYMLQNFDKILNSAKMVVQAV